MSRKEIINNIGYIANKKAKEYVEQRKSHGVNDPYMLNEIEEAYYEGMVQSENFWHPTSELPSEDGKYIVISLPDMYGDTDVFYAEYRQLYGWCYEIEGHYAKINIQKWCYPPKED